MIVALDYPEPEPALELVRGLRGLGLGFKVGLELFTAGGPRVVDAVRAEGGRVFLDLKFHDIGATMEGACRAAARLGVWMTDLHLAAGREGLRRGAAGAREEAARRGETPPLLVGITVLTSLDETALRDDLGVARSLPGQVLALARLGKEAGLDGVVCSPLEVAALKQALGAQLLAVTPGVRPAGGPALPKIGFACVHSPVVVGEGKEQTSSVAPRTVAEPLTPSSPLRGSHAMGDDQRRAATPGEAVRRGADHLVVGRPVTRADDPRRAVERILAEMIMGR